MIEVQYQEKNVKNGDLDKYVKETLKEQGLDFEEIVLGKDATIASVRAITGKETVPQVFIGGEHIGGNDELQAHFAK